MARCEVDPKLERKVIEGFQFPLGAYPVEEMTPKQGYTVNFEPADKAGAQNQANATGSENTNDHDSDGEFEEWPDRYVFDIVISADRVAALGRSLFSLLPPRVYPILDVLGNDAYREIDPYVSYDLVGWDEFVDMARRYRPYLYEDGLVGFGAMSEEPFCYVFLDEHKIFTVRVEPRVKDKVEKILDAFGLAACEDPAGADAVVHEHRGVLAADEDDAELLSADQIVEHLQDRWRLTLNIDPESNVDDQGKPLGVTLWRCLIRFEAGTSEVAADREYGDVLLTASNLREAEELAIETLEQLPGRQAMGKRAAGGDAASEADGGWVEATPIFCDRVRAEDVAAIAKTMGGARKRVRPDEVTEGGVVIASRWIGGR